MGPVRPAIIDGQGVLVKAFGSVAHVGDANECHD